MARASSQGMIHGVKKSQTQLNQLSMHYRINRYTLLYIKEITKKHLLYVSRGNSIRYAVITYKGKESEKEYIYINMRSENVSSQSCLILCDRMDCSLPDSPCPWNFPGENTGVGSHSLLQGIFPTQGSNPSLLCLLH